MQKKISKKEELEFLIDLLKNIENKEAVALVAEVNGKVGGLTHINKKYTECHRGKFGISLRKDFRGKVGVIEKGSKKAGNYSDDVLVVKYL
ncbi:MAG: hypothetical protein DRP06_01905 [Candidatus Aenigmatarchaeota archaeon]|nr:MAG: hypothetical protein DRP06_01905 [Candidatus Aenigmarchaeota archaeon]